MKEKKYDKEENEPYVNAGIETFTFDDLKTSTLVLKLLIATNPFCLLRNIMVLTSNVYHSSFINVSNCQPSSTIWMSYTLVPRVLIVAYAHILV